MQKFLPSENKIIENIIIKIENIWFSKYELSKDLPKDLRIHPWKYESIVLQKLLCEQNGTFLQDNIKNIKYLDKWNASLTLYESRIKLCNQRVKVNFREGQYIYETDNAYQIFDDIGIKINKDCIFGGGSKYKISKEQVIRSIIYDIIDTQAKIQMDAYKSTAMGKKKTKKKQKKQTQTKKKQKKQKQKSKKKRTLRK